MVTNHNEVDAAPRLLAAADVDRIERTLDVSLPQEYRKALLEARPAHVDQTSLLDDADQIIGWTKDYRNGFAGLAKWPADYVYIGDEADACPYVISCKTGEILKLDRGNIDTKPIRSFQTLSALFDSFDSDGDSAWATMPNWRKNMYFYAPVVIGLTVIFVILPLVAIGLKALFVGL